MGLVFFLFYIFILLLTYALCKVAGEDDKKYRELHKEKR